MKWLCGILVAVFIYVVIGVYFGVNEVSATIKQIGWEWWLYTIAAVTIGHLMLLSRWHLDLRLLGYRIPLLASSRLYASGLALIMAPARGGETLRGLWLKRAYGVPIQVGVGITLSDRLLDLTSALLLAAWGLGERILPAVILTCTLAAVVTWVMTHPVAIELLERKRKKGIFPLHWTRLHQVLREILASLTSLRLLLKPWPLLLGISFSTIAWLVEVWIQWRLFLSMNVEMHLSQVAAIRTISSIAGVLSFLPAGLGTSEVTSIGMAVVYGATRPQALAATLILRVSTVLVPFLVGSTVLMTSSDYYRKPKRTPDSETPLAS
jgi:uncharacterized protein (TIRG00374 family)